MKLSELLVSEHLTNLTNEYLELIHEQSLHTGCTVVWQETEHDGRDVEVHCAGCDRCWNAEWTRERIEEIDTTTQVVEWVRNELCPVFYRMSRATCWTGEGAGAPAEWLTQRLAKAGAAGIRWADLCAECEEERVCRRYFLYKAAAECAFLPGERVYNPIKMVAEHKPSIEKWESEEDLRRIPLTDPRNVLIVLPAAHPLNTWTGTGGTDNEEG